MFNVYDTHLQATTELSTIRLTNPERTLTLQVVTSLH